ncbi:MAG: serine hydrolase [Firmicutes bacterium]|jgi:CubicO group peptidase (beta-lactamase class C family)|nr:serine hydrolase [Bacillota bacterium]
MGRTPYSLVAAFVLVAVLSLGASVAIASPESTPAPALTREAVDRFLDEFMPSAMDRLHVPGVTFVAVKDGEILTMRGFGYSDIETARRVDPETTVFRAGSVSKILTGMAVMQLVGRGVVDLDEDVNTYIRGFEIPDTYRERITLRHLLTHTAGFDERNLGMSEFGSDVYPELGEYLAAELPPRVRPPGELAQYSNHGMTLAGYVVECASGTPFVHYVQEHILALLGMVHSSFELTPSMQEQLSSSYQWRRGKYVKVPYVHINLIPAGMLMTTAADMARFIMANLAGGELDSVRVLGAEQVDAMQSQQFTNNPAVPGIGYAWLMGQRNGRRVVFHGGDIWQFSTQLLLAPEEDFGLFVSGNGAGAARLNDELIKGLFDTFFPRPKEEGSAGLTGDPNVRGDAGSAGDPRNLSGVYRMTRSPMTTADKVISLMTELRLSAQNDGTLALTPPAGYGVPPTTWAPVGPGLYRDTAGDDLMAFDEWAKASEGRRPSRVYIGTWAFHRLPFYETSSFALVLLAAIVAVFIWAMLAWAFGRKVSGLAAALGLTDVVAIVGIAASLLTVPNWVLTTAVPCTTRAALVLPLVGIVLAVALAWQTIRRTADANKRRWGFAKRRARQGFASLFLPWLCVVAHMVFVWFLNLWNLLGWRF